MTEMVTGLLIKEGEQFYTDLKEVLGSLGDSSATVIISKDAALIQRIKDVKTEAIDLEEYNR